MFVVSFSLNHPIITATNIDTKKNYRRFNGKCAFREILKTFFDRYYAFRYTRLTGTGYINTCARDINILLYTFEIRFHFVELKYTLANNLTIYMLCFQCVFFLSFYTLFSLSFSISFRHVPLALLLAFQFDFCISKSFGLCLSQMLAIQTGAYFFSSLFFSFVLFPLLLLLLLFSLQII